MIGQSAVEGILLSNTASTAQEKNLKIVTYFFDLLSLLPLRNITLFISYLQFYAFQCNKNCMRSRTSINFSVWKSKAI